MKQQFMIVQTDLNWLYVYPKGIHGLVTHIKDVYKNPPVYITENGNYIVILNVYIFLLASDK
jgi:beta-glucosidase/6-phospho-beta-glucosidase/beta-galactosidase